MLLAEYVVAVGGGVEDERDVEISLLEEIMLLSVV